MKTRPWLLRFLFVLVLLACIYFIYLLAPVWKPFLSSLGKIMLPFLLAGLFAYLLHPVIDFLQRKGVPRALSVLLIYVMFFGGGAWALIESAPILMRQYISFVNEWPEWLQTFENGWLTLHRQIDSLPPILHDQAEKGVSQLQTNGEEMLEGVLEQWPAIMEAIVMLFLLPFLTFYLLKDLQAFEKALVYITPKRWREQGKKLAQAVDHALGFYIRGQLVVSLCVGILSILALWIVQVPYPMILGIFMGLMDLIPYVGPYIGAVPAVIVAITISWETVLFTVIAITIVQQLESNVLSPYIMGKSAHLHPLLILLALLIGYEFAGFIGLLIAVPLFVIAGEVIRVFRKKESEEEAYE
ncbi:putative PurR-regulated permease PerM [Geomicrobium halophilum]|uniref:Putative PurR-regulated permease PerM n=1 Tax=Geomicrobium halophilum TaxID=549000 RepID=A0A841PNW2_9BACL|nr:AI-2E family transporter [Geomicrobium halophilum]MBB6449484.1 putative PurR-regulated permease PerM [Geomicrobium halophilum]